MYTFTAFSEATTEGVLYAKFKGKHLCRSLFFNKATGLQPATSLKNRLWHKRFHANYAKFLKALVLQNTSGQLLLLFPIKFVWYLVKS